MSVMVVPFISSSEKITTKLDSSTIYRAAVNNMNAILKEEGFQVLDYVEWLNSLKNSGMGVQRDLSTQQILNAPADIYIYIEIFPYEFSNGEKEIAIILFANDKYSGERYATSQIFRSSRRRWPDFIYPIEKEIFNQNFNREIKIFIDRINDQIKYIQTHGRLAKLVFFVAEGSSFNFDIISASATTYAEAIIRWIKTYPGFDQNLSIQKNQRIITIEGRFLTFNGSLYELSRALEEHVRKISTSGTGVSISSKIRGSNIDFEIR